MHKFIVIELPVMFLSFGYLSSEILGFKVNSIFAPWIFAYLIYGDLRGRVCLGYSPGSNTFFEFYSATTKLLRKEISGR